MNWFKRIFTRRIEITIQTGQKSSLNGWSQNKYTLILNPLEHADMKTVLAHELGHFMDNVAEGMTKSLEQDYNKSNTKGIVSLPVLKCEASAWRNACKIYPKLDKNHLKYAYGTYVRNWKNPFGWMYQWMDRQIQINNTTITFTNHRP